MADDLFAIDLSGDEQSQDEAAARDKRSNKRDKNRQTEEEFQQLRSEYRPKMENGEIWKTIKLPLGRAAVPKLEAQDLLHAAEELYFYERYAEAAAFVRDVLAGDPAGLDDDTKAMLALYRGRCLQKAGLSGGMGSA